MSVYNVTYVRVSPLYVHLKNKYKYFFIFALKKNILKVSFLAFSLSFFLSHSFFFSLLFCCAVYTSGCLLLLGKALRRIFIFIILRRDPAILGGKIQAYCLRKNSFESGF